MRKQTLCGFIFIICILMFFGCATNKTSILDAKPEIGRYYNNETHFSIMFPEGFQAQDNPPDQPQIAVIAMNKETYPGTNFVVQAGKYDSAFTADKYFDELVSSLEKNPNITMDNKGSASIDNVSANWLINTTKVNDTFYVKQVVYIQLREGYMYTLVFTTPAQEFDANKNMFEKTFNSFRFEG